MDSRLSVLAIDTANGNEQEDAGNARDNSL
jgi:hypothetical protein